VVDEGRIRALSDVELAEAQSIITDELRNRAFQQMLPTRWSLGQLHHELSDLPADMAMLVNVHVEVPGEAGTGFIPLAVVGGGFGVIPGENGAEDEILPIYNIDTEPIARADGRLIWVRS
jgi:hypothetical protein